MSVTTFLIALFLALGVMVISIGFIFHQLKLSRVRENKIREGEERLREERQKRIDSIKVLLKVAGTDELNWIEASIRIKNLLDQLSIDLSAHEDIVAFYIIEEKTQHIPTHEQWGSLPKMAKVKFCNEMDAYEAEYKGHLHRAKVALLAYPLS
ncbi:DUF2489 domain-containing protein [Marinomonas transparens]|uniref:DUF2489 domain-containing protein n=1 Tax=Marinomonas transparens TaxID=2795388 RepID=A0A934N0V8_9GAMM|nr:DUF2489 domain-containing protein [Marinomonas transparens]MBJ7538930.1 DUF2489 domain-containing protein [Marinomonas transparens]